MAERPTHIVTMTCGHRAQVFVDLDRPPFCIECGRFMPVAQEPAMSHTMTAAQQSALRHYADGDTGWRSCGEGTGIRWATARALARLGLLEIGEPRSYYGVLRRTAFGRDYYSTTVVETPVRLTEDGWKTARALDATV